MKKIQNHILDALESISKAHSELSEQVENHEKILYSQGQDIDRLEKQVMELRNNAIQAEVNNGTPTCVVAKKYSVSSSRISQIAPRNTHQRKIN